MPRVHVYIPSHNPGAELLETLNSAKAFPCIVSDNCSDNPDSKSYIEQAKQYATVIEQPHNIGRIGNWNFCIEHFLKGDGEWMKWLFLGDQLLPNAQTTIDNAIMQFPEAKLIVCPFYVVDKHSRKINGQTFKQSQLLSPEEAVKLSANKGGWIGNLLSLTIHRDALQNSERFSEDFPFSGDFKQALNMSSKYPVLYYDSPIGEFHVQSRKYFSSNRFSPEASIEHGLVQIQAAKMHYNQTKNLNEYNTLLNNIERTVIRQLVLRACARRFTKFKLFQDLHQLYVKFKS